MFRVEAQLEILASSKLTTDSSAITIRGYRQEDVAVPAEFSAQAPVSVGDVVGMCPVHQDIFLRKKEKAKSIDNWGKTAGTYIEEFLKVILEAHTGTDDPSVFAGSSEKLFNASRELYSSYSDRNAKSRKKLAQLAKNSFDLALPELDQLLVNSGAFDLFYLQGALNYSRYLTSEKQLSAIEINRSFTPADYTKISPDSRPDLVAPKFKTIGDVKSGQYKQEYLLTVAGYALAYESASQKDMDVGVLYLVETQSRVMGASRALFFRIGDDLRRYFLNRRNALLSVLSCSSRPGALKEDQMKEKYCSRCSFSQICHPTGLGL